MYDYMLLWCICDFWLLETLWVMYYPLHFIDEGSKDRRYWITSLNLQLIDFKTQVCLIQKLQFTVPSYKCCILKKIKFEIEETVTNIFVCHCTWHTDSVSHAGSVVLQEYMFLGIEAGCWTHCARGRCWEGSIVANPLAKNMGKNRKGRVPVCLQWQMETMKGLKNWSNYKMFR